MSPSTIHAVFKKAGITIRHMWETRFSDPEIPHLNRNDKIDEQLESLTNGYFIITNYGQLEVRYGLTSMMIRVVNDYGHDAPVTFTRILPTTVNMLDTSVIIEALRFFKDQRYK